MLDKFRPTIYCSHVKDIEYSKLKEKGIKLLCFDLDNTLDFPDKKTENIDPKIELLLNKLKNEFEILIVSNNTIKGRVSSFANKINFPYIESMKKPFQYNYRENTIIKKYQKHEIVFIGDKIITDVLGAGIFGSKSVLVDPLYPKSKKWYYLIMHVSDNIFQKLISLKRGNYYVSKEQE